MSLTKHFRLSSTVFAFIRPCDVKHSSGLRGIILQGSLRRPVSLHSFAKRSFFFCTRTIWLIHRFSSKFFPVRLAHFTCPPPPRSVQLEFVPLSPIITIHPPPPSRLYRPPTNFSSLAFLFTTHLHNHRLF